MGVVVVVVVVGGAKIDYYFYVFLSVRLASMNSMWKTMTISTRKFHRYAVVLMYWSYVI